MFWLLLGLLLASGIWLWNSLQTDPCARYATGDKSLPASQRVVLGSRTVEVSCNDWFMRQPVRVEVLCLLDLALGVLFVLNALGDLREWMAMRRRWNATR